MNKDSATKIFMEYIEKEHKKIKILSIDEKKDRFLFEFCEEKEAPIDYPIISVMKNNGKIDELSFLNKKDRDIIYG